MDQKKTVVSRRTFLKSTTTAGIALAAPTLWIPRASAGTSLTVADVGGSVAPALRKAFYDPFEKETGIRIINVAHEANPVTQFKLAVDSGSQIWDVAMVTPDHALRLTESKNYLAPLGIAPGDAKGILPHMLTSNWFGFSVWATILAFRSDKYAKASPTGWKDYWDVTRFAGRRGLFRSPIGTFEAALMADGVAPHDVYPMNVDRALASLSKIRSAVSVWWSNGAQNTQILQSGEVDMTDTWNARGYAAIQSGAPVKMVWEGTYNIDGWSIVANTLKLADAQRFVRFCMRPDRQAEYCTMLPYGPSNADALRLVDSKRAEILTTYPKNLERLVLSDSAWWSKNFDTTNERFQEWLLQS